MLAGRQLMVSEFVVVDELVGSIRRSGLQKMESRSAVRGEQVRS